LLRGIARTAVVAGTATAVSNGVSRRQQARWADQGPAEPEAYAPPPPAPAAAGSDLVSQLKELAALKEQGVLTDEEFATQKARLLA
jgi:Short C-terminal domain